MYLKNRMIFDDNDIIILYTIMCVKCDNFNYVPI